MQKIWRKHDTKLAESFVGTKAVRLSLIVHVPYLLTKARVESSDSVDINQKVTKLGLRYLYLAKSDLH